MYYKHSRTLEILDFRSTSTGRNSAAVDGIVAGVTILAVIVIVTAIVTVTFCVKKRRSKATTRPPDM